MSGLERITQKTVARMADLARKGLPRGTVESVTDPECRGLSIRVQGTTAGWFVRYKSGGKQQMVRIGAIWPASDPWTIGIAQARDIGTAILGKLRADVPRPEIDEYIRVWHVSRDHSATKNEIAEREAHRATTWTFGETLDRYLDHKRKNGPEKRVDGKVVRLPPNAKTIADIQSVFRRPAIVALRDRVAATLKRRDLEAVRNAISEDSGPSTSNKAVTYIRSALRHACKYEGGASGLDGADDWWDRLAATHKIVPKDRTPEIDDLVKTLILAEAFLDRPLPARSIRKASVLPGTLAGLWWVVLTAQRSGTGLRLKREDVTPFDGREGWFVATWSGAEMKGGRTHALPIPVRAVEHLRRINPAEKESGWFFPSERGDGEMHVTESGVYRILRRLAAKDAMHKPSRENYVAHVLRRSRVGSGVRQVDLMALNGIAWWSPHDVRRTITSKLAKANIPGGASLVLAHSVDEGTKHGAELPVDQRVAAVTRKSYGGDAGPQFLPLKDLAMQVWVDAVLDAYDRIKGEWQPLLDDLSWMAA